MIPNLNNPIWAAIDFFDAFRLAMRERLNTSITTNVNEVFYGDAWAVIEVGARLQGSSSSGLFNFLSIWSVSQFQKFVMERYQPFAEEFVVPFVDAPNASRAKRTKTLSEFFEGAGLSPMGFRRVRPREVQLPTAQIDALGTPAAVGHRAYLVNAFQPTHEQGKGVYEFNGSIWIPSPQNSPDILDSQAGTLAYGVMVYGDYMGEWLWKEIAPVFSRCGNHWY